MSRRRVPRTVSDALADVRERLAPETPLARAQACWSDAVGARIAAAATPISEADGVVTIGCESAVWAQELDMMQGEIIGRLRAESGLGEQLLGVRFTTVTTRPFF